MSEPLTTLQYTPGPWRASFFAGKWCVLHKGGDDTTILAGVGGGFAGIGDAQSNAAVMAAALDMLAALKLIAEFGGKTLIAPSLGPDADRGHQIGANKAFDQAADIAREAIASLMPQESKVP